MCGEHSLWNHLILKHYFYVKESTSLMTVFILFHVALEGSLLQALVASEERLHSQRQPTASRQDPPEPDGSFRKYQIQTRRHLEPPRRSQHCRLQYRHKLAPISFPALAARSCQYRHRLALPEATQPAARVTAEAHFSTTMTSITYKMRRDGHPESEELHLQRRCSFPAFQEIDENT